MQELSSKPILQGHSAGLAAETGSGKTLAYLAPLISSLLREKRASNMPTSSVSSARCCSVLPGIAIAVRACQMHALSLGSCTTACITCQLLHLHAVSMSDIGLLMAFWCCAPMQPWAARYAPQARLPAGTRPHWFDLHSHSYPSARCFMMPGTIRGDKARILSYFLCKRCTAEPQAGV